MQEFKLCNPTDHQTLILCLLHIPFQWGTIKKKKTKGVFWPFQHVNSIFHSDIQIKQQRMFKQRFQSQTLLACLFNYISGRLQLSSKSGLCFHRLLEFSAYFDPAASIQFNNSIQNKPSQPCWSQCQLCSSIHQGLGGKTRFSSLFSHSGLCVTAPSSSDTHILVSGRCYSSLKVQYRASTSLCAFPCSSADCGRSWGKSPPAPEQFLGME